MGTHWELHGNILGTEKKKKNTKELLIIAEKTPIT
jgi:hypothetical protein